MCSAIHTALKITHLIHLNLIQFRFQSAEGVVKVDPSGLEGRKGTRWKPLQLEQTKSCCATQHFLFVSAVFVYLACAFRYGSDDLDVMGLSFRRDIWIQRIQVYPPTGDPPKSEMVDFLMKKVGEQGQAFSFQVPQWSQPHFFPPEVPTRRLIKHGWLSLCSSDANRPALLSVLTARAWRCWQGTHSTLSHTQTSFKCLLHKIIYPQLVLLQACGVDFEIKAYLANVALNPDEVIDKKYAPPVAETRFQTQMNVCPMKLFLFSFLIFF